jgi:tyrosine-protein kinase Etk/Wzc
MGQIQSIEEFISLVLRRRWLIIAVALIGMVLSVVVAKSKVDTYESVAVIQVEMPTVNSGGGDGTVPAASGSAQMLQTIEQRLTTRESLTAMIERHGLFADAPGIPIDKQVFALRQSVTFQSVDSAAGQSFGQARAISAIIIFARWGDAEMAARIANDFAQGILDQSSAGQIDRAEENVRFFRDEEARLWAEIGKIEDEIATYKAQHADALPDLGVARQDELVNLETDLRRLQEEFIGLQSTRDLLDAKENKRETDRRQIAELEGQLQVIQKQMGALKDRQNVLNASLASTPAVERVLSGLARRLTQAQDQHQAASQLLAEAQTNERLASRQKSERFTLLERALIPEYPTGGGRKKIAMAGAVASLLGGLVLAFLLDLMKPVIRTSRQMERQLDLQPVVSIPEIRNAKGAITLQLVPLIANPRAKTLLGLPNWAVLGGAVFSVLLLMAAVLG